MKKQVKRFVYLVLSLMFLVTSILGVPRLTSAANSAPVTLSSLVAGNTVNFGGKTWIVLDPSTGYLLLQGFDSKRLFDPDSTNNTFDPNDLNNIAYYINNDFYSILDSADLPLILSHYWTIGNEGNELSAIASCKIGLISYSEWNNYKNIIGNSSSYFWTRTPDSGSSPYNVWYVHPYGDMYSVSVFNNFFARPALYLYPGIFVSGDSTHTVLGGKYHTVNVLTNSAAGGMVTGGGEYANGESVPVMATPNTGYNFVNWTDKNGASVSTSLSYSYTMGSADTILVANFQQAPIIPTITVVNGIPFSVTVRNTYGTLTGTNSTYGALSGTASGNDTVIAGTLSGLSTTTPTDITLGNGTIEIKAVNPPSTTLDNSKSFY